MGQKQKDARRPRRTDADQLIGRAQSAWKELWKETVSELSANSGLSYLEDQPLIEAIQHSLRATSKSYHYVLPTQLIAKHVNSLLDAKCIQARRGGQGAFDARSVAHQVIVPFDAENQNVLGGAPEPYINNPLRVLEITNDPKVRGQQKDKVGWDSLFEVLNRVESRNSPSSQRTYSDKFRSR